MATHIHSPAQFPCTGAVRETAFYLIARSRGCTDGDASKATTRPEAPTHLEASFKLMEIALNHKKSDLAIKVMESAVENNPDEPLAYYNLISVYDKCKMFEQAEEARKRLKERFAKKAKESSVS